MKLAVKLRRRWREPGGYRELTQVALPLVVSTGSMSVQFFAERVVQTWYSPEEMAAALPAGITAFMLLFLFAGTAGYTSVFVAQYLGAKRPERLGASLTAGLSVALVALVAHLLLIPLAGPFFRMIGHDPALVVQETAYFQALCWRAAPATANWAIAGYFSGRHKTLPVMWVNLAMIAVAVSSFYPLIHGVGDWQGLGIPGGAWGEVIAQCVGLLLNLCLLARRSERELLGVGRVPLWDWTLLRRLLRYGLPRGIHMFAEVAGFAVFILVLGRLGPAALGATAITFDINSLVFMPMGGLAMGVSALIGQRLGRDQPDIAARILRQGLRAAYVWVGVMSVLYLFAPAIFLWPFDAGSENADWPEMSRQIVILLRFVVLYAFFDATAFVTNSALGGAGDTRVPLRWMLALSISVLVLPTWIGLRFLGGGLYTAWTCLTVYLGVLAVAYTWRFRSGHWRHMRVIESAPVPAVAPADVPLPLDLAGPVLPEYGQISAPPRADSPPSDPK